MVFPERDVLPTVYPVIAGQVESYAVGCPTLVVGLMEVRCVFLEDVGPEYPNCVLAQLMDFPLHEILSVARLMTAPQRTREPAI